ncbi:hypothetical protein HUK80_15710 [Flavobacterium sp. MAH-1]|uniref:Uncharacterized protein n=1 Tax=Flavobacterium agri TaxID=2743471 RepID=A0A7Y9C6Q7_9FLAO|nr:hypothetical protein [Flavobacterium agri]NUY82351.1 hypothetical protein [Flavobacterium agri]NYA72375.1 hypothetical protein [Flavobacterium agri]
MKYLITIFIIFQTSFCEAQQTLPNEEIVFSFKTANAKILTLAKDKRNKYLVYRFGTINKTELEFPNKNLDSWKVFTYSYYFRGGGKQNARMDLDNLWFVNEGFEYLIFSSYNAGDDEISESFEVGLKITNLKTGKETIINGIENSVVGSLQQFRTNNLIKIDYYRID